MINPQVVLLRATHQSLVLRSCRRVAGHRLPLTARTLHTTSRLRKDDAPTDPTASGRDSNPASNDPKPSTEEGIEKRARAEQNLRKLEDVVALLKGELQNSGQETESGQPAPKVITKDVNVSSDPETQRRTAESKFYGSAKRRATRNRPDGYEEKYVVPSWFVEKNIRLAGSSSASDIEIVSQKAASEEKIPESSTEPPVDPPNRQLPTSSTHKPDSEQTSQTRRGIYQVDEALFNEIVYSVSAGLRLGTNDLERGNSNTKPHLVLQSPKEGAEVFLDGVVNKVQERLGVDVISVNANDIADIANENPGFFSNEVIDQLQALPFETHVDPDEGMSAEMEESEDPDDAMEPEEDEMQGPQWRSSSFSPPDARGWKAKRMPFGDLVKKLFPGAKGVQVVTAKPMGFNPFGNMDTSEPQNGEVFFNDNKSSEMAFIHKFFDTMKQQRGTPSEEKSENQEESAKASSATSSKPVPRGVIVHVKDYLEIKSTRIGGILLQRIHEAVAQLRRWNEPVIIVGTTSANDLLPMMSKSGFKSIQTGTEDADLRTIITHCRSPDAEALFTEDSKALTTSINCRNILSTFRQQAITVAQLEQLSSAIDLGLGSEELFVWGLGDSVWPREQVLRMVSVALGVANQGQTITTEHVVKALSVIESSDDSKFKWLDTERSRKVTMDPGSDNKSPKKASNPQIEKLMRTSNPHEKKLLNGVIDAKSINTTFADVRAPESTVEALKTLTSLSLVRPDAFKYGVLATDQIPGLLLYGPPGTGKTLLAKAVARESGATVLTIAGSDVFDKYVGEGEKNVRAIFSLAKKLSPCVVFIDEADAIFGSRNTSGNRTSHRELINEFLREWDGMNTMSAFIMVATNRPFDLDDAVLRRLPRRLLVDLPTEQDRESILGIHLKGENLSEGVSLSQIASETPFYSGSDLKNLSVAAALACVREENAAAASHQGEEPYKYPERRTLTKEHFEKAMQEISASISEDMSTLTAIRKFDEKYGDRKGRKKKSSGLGFGMMTDKEREKLSQEEGRVRKEPVQ